jgi:hypothetical protein
MSGARLLSGRAERLVQPQGCSAASETTRLAPRVKATKKQSMEEFEQEQSGEEQLDDIEEEPTDLEATADELGEEDDEGFGDDEDDSESNF